MLVQVFGNAWYRADRVKGVRAEEIKPEPKEEPKKSWLKRKKSPPIGSYVKTEEPKKPEPKCKVIVELDNSLAWIEGLSWKEATELVKEIAKNVNAGLKAKK